MPRLALGRATNEVLHFDLSDGREFTLTVISARTNKCRLLMDAPPDVVITRGELLARHRFPESDRSDMSDRSDLSPSTGRAITCQP